MGNLLCLCTCTKHRKVFAAREDTEFTAGRPSCRLLPAAKPSEIASPKTEPDFPQSRDGIATSPQQAAMDANQDSHRYNRRLSSEPEAGQPAIPGLTSRPDADCENILDGSECLLESNVKGSVSIYKPPVKCVFTENGVAKCVVGGAKVGEIEQPPSVVLLLVGATGVGKSTLINGIANYVLGVRWEDSFRYKVITDERAVGQAHSQTQRVTIYTFQKQASSPLPYTLTVIDTPGFGDTEGVDRDKQILTELKQFFSVSGINSINAIGFVTQATLARLTPTQRYIFDSIMSIFGKNIANNILLMATFADFRKPPVLEALRKAEVPYHMCFKFNNSALYPVPDDEDAESHDSEAQDNCLSLNKLFWDLCMKGFMNLFDALSHMKARSLCQTTEVLQEREQLALIVKGLQERGLMVIAKIEELIDEQRILNHHHADLEANQTFQYTVHVGEHREEDSMGVITTNCTACHFTCHYNCSCQTPDEKEEFNCAVLLEGKCTVCPEKCKRANHTRSTKLYTRCIVKKLRSSEDITTQCGHKPEMCSQDKLVAKQIELVAAQYYEAFLLVHHAQQTIGRLNALALKPKSISGTECIDVLIQIEEDRREPQYKERVNRLRLIQSEVGQLSEFCEEEYYKRAQQKAQELAK